MGHFNEMETVLRIKPADSIKFIQITDTHILDDGAPLFSGFDTSVSLLEIIENIRKDESDADFILLTGDLIHEATKTAYQKLADHLSTLTKPVFYLPGNHDEPLMMNEVMSINGHAAIKVIKVGQWSIILLNTCVIGEHRGELSRSELDFLTRALESNSDSHCLVALHHHPVSISSTWMDGMPLTNSKEFLDIIDNFDHVRAIIWGHIHQEFELLRNNVTFIGTPSTCLQFKPKSDEFNLDEKPPAYRRIELQSNGLFNSSVIYSSK